MKLKTFTAGSVAEAVAMVKRELGADAVILNARRRRRGGILGIGAKHVVEVTAADGRSVRSPRRPGDARPAKQAGAAGGARPGGAPSRRPTRPDSAGAGDPGSDANANAGELIRRTYMAAQAEMRGGPDADPNTAAAGSPASRSAPADYSAGGHGSGSGPGSVAAAIAAAPPQPSSGVADAARLSEEMKTVKRMIERLSEQQRKQAGQHRPDLPDTLFDEYLGLLRQDVEEELAEEIVNEVKSQLTDAEIRDNTAVRAAVTRQIARLTPTEPGEKPLQPSADGGPRVITLIGPTGVGKTTTVAKLAATFKLKQSLNVGLITLDTYRIAAVDQLRTYASIIGVPLHVAINPEELKSALRKTRGCDVVLIDTAGHGHRDDPKLEQLQQFLDAATPDEVHLVLSSTSSQRVLEEATERFSRLRVDRLIFTKLDEAVSFGVLLNVMRKVNKRLSYITTGQEVPHHIEPGRPERFAELVLGDRA